jgi:hypothetical protein
MYFIPAAVILLASIALIVQVSVQFFVWDKIGEGGRAGCSSQI